jgi:coproporphyrinogen III oxidase
VLLMGSESAACRRCACARRLAVRIPLAPGMRSLNVAVATEASRSAEALRQTWEDPYPDLMRFPGIAMAYRDDEQQAARDLVRISLRDQICAEFEAIEAEAGSDASFDYLAWDRTDPSGAPGGGGVRGVMKGKVFEKVGVNVSTVGGTSKAISPRRSTARARIRSFFATGISLVAHMANPHVPAVHMNTRFLVTTKRWFGGGADLNPPIPVARRHGRFPRHAEGRVRRA